MKTRWLSAIGSADVLKSSRPLSNADRHVSSSTPATTGSPAASPAMRRASTSMPVTRKPASAAAHASESPT